MSPIQWAKLWLVDHLDLAKDALHVHAGLLIFFAAAALFRWPLRSWRPWTAVLVAAIGMEIWHLRDSIRYETPISLRANLKDVVNTIFWPTALLLLARHTRLLTRR